MKDFRSLRVWEKAHILTLATYKVTMKFPKREMYGLTSQIRRSVASIPSNIAEGCGRGTNGEMNRFLRIAMGSASEVEYQLLLAHDLNLLDEQPYRDLSIGVVEIKKMLSSFIKKLTAES